MKASGKMGGHLQQEFGLAYMNFGITFNSGTYSAYDDKPFYEVHQSYPGTYEYILSKCKDRNFFLDLRIPEVKKIFDSRAGFRSIGSMPQEVTQFSEMRLTENFDLIAFITVSHHSIRNVDAK
jgi:erythromycin esterase-like protein